MNRELDRLIARHERYLTRVNRMLDADDRGDGFPDGTEFHEEELQSIDSACRDVLIQILGKVPEPGDWMAPNRYAFVNGYAKSGAMTWLVSLKSGLIRSRDYLQSIARAEKQRSGPDDGRSGPIAAQVVVGEGASTGDIAVTGGVASVGGTREDMGVLLDELDRLRAALREAADKADPSGDIDIGKVTAAQAAAESGNVEGMRDQLKDMGAWVLRVAEKIGVNTIVELLKASAGS